MDPSELAERTHERLRRMLDRAGIANREVARRAGVAGETVSRWRSGQQRIGDEELTIIIAMLAEKGVMVTPGWIRYGELPAASPRAPAADVAIVDREVDEVPDPKGEQAAAPAHTDRRRTGS